jgi:hypothetical protein
MIDDITDVRASRVGKDERYLGDLGRLVRASLFNKDISEVSVCNAVRTDKYLRIPAPRYP